MIHNQPSTIEDLKKIADNYQSIVQLYSYGLFAKAVTTVVQDYQMKVDQVISNAKNEVEVTIFNINETTKSIIDQSITNFLDQFQEKIIDELDDLVKQAIERNFPDE